MSGWAEYLRLPARAYAALAIVSGAITFAPEPFMGRIGLTEFHKEYRGWVGITFLLACGLLFAEVVAKGWAFWRKTQDLKRTKLEAQAGEAQRLAESHALTDASNAKRIARLSQLTVDEKGILLLYTSENRRSRRLRANSGTYHALLAAGILNAGRQLQEIRSNGMQIEVYIEQWALEHLLAHPELLT